MYQTEIERDNRKAYADTRAKEKIQATYNEERQENRRAGTETCLSDCGSGKQCQREGDSGKELMFW
jgi:hypothetical protein